MCIIISSIAVRIMLCSSLVVSSLMCLYQIRGTVSECKRCGWDCTWVNWLYFSSFYYSGDSVNKFEELNGKLPLSYCSKIHDFSRGSLASCSHKSLKERLKPQHYIETSKPQKDLVPMLTKENCLLPFLIVFPLTSVYESLHIYTSNYVPDAL